MFAALFSSSTSSLFRQSGSSQWLGAFKTRLPYMSLTSTLASDTKAPERSFLSGALASTLFRDTARGSTLTGGVQVKSGKFNPNVSMMPGAVASVAAKLEYDEPDFNIDAKVRAHNYTNTQTHAQGLKISNAYANTNRTIAMRAAVSDRFFLSFYLTTCNVVIGLLCAGTFAACGART